MLWFKLSIFNRCCVHVLQYSICIASKRGCRSLAWPAPNKDRWPVLKTDGWVFGLQQIGLRRALNQGMAPPTTSLLLSSDKTNRFPPPPCYRYTHTGFLVCTVMATPVITPLMVMGPLIRMQQQSGSVLQRSVFFFLPVSRAFMPGNGEGQMITPCQLQNGHLTQVASNILIKTFSHLSLIVPISLSHWVGKQSFQMMAFELFARIFKLEDELVFGS